MAVRVYDIIFVMTDGGPAQSTQVMATWMVKQIINFSKFGIGTTIACLMVLVLMIVIIPFVIYMARD